MEKTAKREPFLRPMYWAIVLVIGPIVAVSVILGSYGIWWAYLLGLAIYLGSVLFVRWHSRRNT